MSVIFEMVPLHIAQGGVWGEGIGSWSVGYGRTPIKSKGRCNKSEDFSHPIAPLPRRSGV